MPTRKQQPPQRRGRRDEPSRREKPKRVAEESESDYDEDEDFEEVRRKRDIQKQLLSEWHQTVEKFRDDYKAKRKAAVRRSKRLGGKVFK